jgi:hypothetical protein
MNFSKTMIKASNLETTIIYVYIYIFVLRFTNTLLQENLKFVFRVKFRINSTNPSRCVTLTETCCVFCQVGAEFHVSVLCAYLQNLRSICYSAIEFLIRDPIQNISGHPMPMWLC